MSDSTKNRRNSASNGLRTRAAQAGTQAGTMVNKSMPLSQQAGPMMSSAGNSARQGAGNAMSMATPASDAVRSWAAPQLEHYAKAVSDSIAPALSSALMNASHTVEVPKKRKGKNTKNKKRKRKGGTGLWLGSLLLGLAGAAAGAAIAQRMRHNKPQTVPMAPSESVIIETEPTQTTYVNEPIPDVDGYSRIV